MMAPYKIIRQGYMLKEPPPSKRGLRKKLHRYWFVLVEDKHQVALVYFKNEESYLSRHRNEGFIRVDDSLSIDVIGEYMNSKTAFAVTTPKTKYYLVPESRYDLHEWIATLHHAIEDFQKRQQRAKGKQHRQRASSTSSATPTSPSGKTTPTTPTRRAPPPPPGARTRASSTSGTPSRRKPVRPAPIAPAGKQRDEQMQGAAAFSPSPPMGYTPDLSMPLSQELPVSPFGTLTSMESGHPVLELDISQTEDLHRVSPQPTEPIKAPIAFQSASDNTLVKMHESTHSMPELSKHEESASPEEPPGYATDGELPRKRSATISASVGGHTRHLSLTGVLDVKPSTRKKRSSKRQGSLKQRSRSPPNLPPPPPPFAEGKDDHSSQDLGPAPELQIEEPAPHSGMRPQASSASLGFSEVMNTISNIDQQLDELSTEISSSPLKPTVPVPKRSSAFDSIGFSSFKPIRDSPVQEEDEQIEFVAAEEDETRLETVPAQATAMDHPDGQSIDTASASAKFYSVEFFAGAQEEVRGERSAPEGGTLSPQTDPDDLDLIDKNLSPIKVTEKQVPSRIFFPDDETTQHQHTDEVGTPPKVENTDQKPPKPTKPRVMFKEEVEDIPSYEPRGDEEIVEEIPSTVAELKRMLFGDQEAEVKMFRKGEGSQYHASQDSYFSPNDSHDVEQRESPTASSEGNVYDMPWDKKPGSKFRVIGHRKKGPKGQKDRLQFAEVSAHDTPIPGNTEVRNVHSLERSKRVGRTKDNTLLESISNSLQGKSKYGSDSLLNSTSNSQQLSPPRRRNIVRVSSKGELEKIKAEHRRDPRYSPHASPKSAGAQKPAKKVGFTLSNGQPRHTASWDGFQRDPNTQVTFDSSTQSHIFRSLV